MSNDKISRRGFVKDLAMAGGAIVMGTRVLGAANRRQTGKLHLACNQYPWTVFYQRDNRNFNNELDKGLGELAASGMDGYEPLANNPQELDRLGPLLKKHSLQMRSLYVNSVLHEPDKADESIEAVLAIAEKAKGIGTKIIVTNPSPIQWGGPQNKNDAQLKVQAAALEKLGLLLKAMGLTLSYHNHDIELRNAAREFHHMMLGTDPESVTLCLDAHWIYRGAGNSAVALFDVLKLYGQRINELHIRQSKDNIWTETFGEGDIDYPALAKYLLNIGIKPHIVLEQAVEAGSPKTMSTIEAFKKSSQYARRVFADFA
ncbi:MAG TPA: TIM barrel protein [Sedimentisphaerales bacterium]|nr:TIM barrel protein [Sedimentisphaerales bacterium]